MYPAELFLSKKKFINALWSFAPLPLYTGNPDPVILLPNSKSIMSYSFDKSQWFFRLYPDSLKLELLNTSILFSSESPSGTFESGILGTVVIRFDILILTVSNSSAKLFDFNFKFDDSDLRLSMSISLLPDLNASAISLEIVLDLKSILSSSCCIFFDYYWALLCCLIHLDF